MPKRLICILRSLPKHQVTSKAISFGKVKPTALPTNPIHIIRYSSLLTTVVMLLTIFLMASAV